MDLFKIENGIYIFSFFFSLLLQSISLICNHREAWFKNAPSKEGKNKFTCLNNTLKMVAIEDFKEDFEFAKFARKGKVMHHPKIRHK